MGYTHAPEASPPASSVSRARALALASERDAIEAEMSSLISALTAPGAPGLTGNLVDADGFPRADIDIPAVREQRYRLDCLRNDHKRIAALLEQNLHAALAPGSASAASPPSAAGAALPSPSSDAAPTQLPARGPASAPSPVVARVPVPPNRVAFAVVDEVSSGSPAADAGLAVRDEVLAFGAVSLHAVASVADAMRALPGLLQSHRGQTVDVVVSRGVAGAGVVEREMVTLKLTPAEWAGNGLMGCHVVPVDAKQEDSRYAPQVATAVATRTAGAGMDGEGGLNSHLNS
jgi:26S proteasome regulatory subunit N4